MSIGIAVAEMRELGARMQCSAATHAEACKEQLRRMRASIADGEVHLAASRAIIVDTIGALDLLAEIAREQSGSVHAAWIARQPSSSRFSSL